MAAVTITYRVRCRGPLAGRVRAASKWPSARVVGLPGVTRPTVAGRRWRCGWSEPDAGLEWGGGGAAELPQSRADQLGSAGTDAETAARVRFRATSPICG